MAKKAAGPTNKQLMAPSQRAMSLAASGGKFKPADKVEKKFPDSKFPPKGKATVPKKSGKK